MGALVDPVRNYLPESLRDPFGDPIPGLMRGNSRSDNRKRVSTGQAAFAKGMRPRANDKRWRHHAV